MISSSTVQQLPLSPRLLSERESSVEIMLCGPQERDLWDAYVHHAPRATMCHQFAWRPIIQQAYGHRTFYLMARSEDQVRGVLPLVLVKRPLFGRSLTSMPFLDYGGICADDEAVAKRLMDYAVRLRQEHHIDSVELRQCEPPAQTGTVRLDKVSMILDLSSGAKAVWRSLPAKVRNQVRKAKKSGLTASAGGCELLDEFYDVFAVNMRDLGSPVHDRAFFSTMLAEFGSHAKLVVARDGRRAVGGLVCLFFKDTVLVPWASSLREYFPKCPNNLLYWEAIQFGCARGCTRFDFGRSSIGSGTYDFKEQWGAKPRQLYWHVLSKNGRQSTTLSAANPKYRLALEVWRRLPLTLTKVLGPRIRKYLTN